MMEFETIMGIDVKRDELIMMLKVNHIAMVKDLIEGMCMVVEMLVVMIDIVILLMRSLIEEVFMFEIEIGRDINIGI